MSRYFYNSKILFRNGFPVIADANGIGILIVAGILSEAGAYDALTKYVFLRKVSAQRRNRPILPALLPETGDIRIGQLLPGRFFILLHTIGNASCVTIR